MVGHDDQSLAAMGSDEIEFFMTNALSISTSTTYYGTDVQGNVRRVTKEEYEDANDKGGEDGIAPCDNSYTTYSTDGYFRILLTTAYADPETMDGEEGWYLISGTYTFINGMPLWRYTDAASLASTNLIWGHYYTQYTSRMYYTYTNASGNSTSTYELKSGNERIPAGNGFYYDWDLPNDVLGSKTVTAISVYLRGVAGVQNDTDPTNFDVYGKFAHIYTEIFVDPVFTWASSGLPGVEISAGLQNSTRSYWGMLTDKYTP